MVGRREQNLFWNSGSELWFFNTTAVDRIQEREKEGKDDWDGKKRREKKVYPGTWYINSDRWYLVLVLIVIQSDQALYFSTYT